MAEDESNSPRPSTQRRSSIAELFAKHPSDEFSKSPSTSSSLPKAGSAMASAMAEQAQRGSSHQRRLSVTTLGLSGSPAHLTQASPFASLRPRGASTESGDGARDENAVEEDDSLGPIGKSAPQTPNVARRLSFGAKVYNEAQMARSPGDSADDSSGGTGTTPNTSTGSGSPPSTRTNGFNWSESLRNRAQRTSISAASGQQGLGTNFLPLTPGHGRKSSSEASAPQPISVPPPAPMPVQQTTPQRKKGPDHFQERILKGDFYMD